MRDYSWVVVGVMATREVGRLVVIGRAEGAGETFLTLASML